MIVHTYKILFIAALALALAACGFQLRGELSLAEHLSPVYLQSQKSVELRNELRALFRSNRVALAKDSKAAASRLLIDDITKRQRVISVDARGRAREYELDFKLRYSFRFDADDEHRQQMTREVELSRELVFDPDSVLAVDEEITTLYRDMEQDAAHIILRQLQAVK